MSGQKTSGSKAVSAIGTAGNIVQASGPYKFSGPIDITVYLAKGDQFPGSPIPADSAATTATAKSATQATAATSWSMITDTDAAAATEEK